MKIISVFGFFLLNIVCFSTFSATMALGENHTVLLNENGFVWTFGQNNYGQLGHKAANKLKEPKRIENLALITAVGAGCSHTVLLDSCGFVWTFRAWRFR